MSGYRCVNFTDLCRLCSSASNNNILIFSDDGLRKKIMECLPIKLNEKDKLPKVICNSCLDYVETFADFRQSCSNAQTMLESCLNTSKLRNGGQVYIKDEVPSKKVLKPIQSPSTKLIPNLCNIMTSPQTKQVKKNILTSPNQTDSLSSIMQIVGIQTNDDQNDNLSLSQNIQPQQSLQPQYTFTLDGSTLKSGQIHYKIENAGNLNLQSQPQIITKNVQDAQSQQLDEFLKLTKKPVVLKKNPPAIVAQAEEPKKQKPKFNLILQASPQKQKIGTQVNVSPKTFMTSSSLNTPTKPQIQIHNIEKMPPTQNTNTKQIVLPYISQHNRNDAAQIISQALAMSAGSQIGVDNKNQANTPFAYVQMKIQPNADGQLTLTPASTLPPPQQLQLSLSPQQFQQLSFQTSSQHPPALAMPPQITVTQMPPQEQADRHTQTPTQPVSKVEAVHEDEDSFDNNDDDFCYMGSEGEESNGEELQEKSNKPALTIIKKKIKSDKKVKNEDLTELQSVQQEHSDMAKKQLNQLTSFNIKREQKSESDTEKPSTDLNLTVCDVCKKVFKRKEFLMQHLKSHIGLRPFKCNEPTCNKSFSRKEHLLRHEVSHTGQKMFTCDVCKKLFSRKDNLNKHRRIHPESGSQSLRHSCPNCHKGFSHRGQLAKHQIICDGKTDGNEAADEESAKEEKTKPAPPPAKRSKTKTEKKSQEPAVKPAPIVIQAPQHQQQQQQIVTILPQHQVKVKQEAQQPQQIIISMSQAQAMFQQAQQQQQQKNAVYTFPNLVHGTFMTSTGEVVSNFKFDSQ